MHAFLQFCREYGRYLRDRRRVIAGFAAMCLIFGLAFLLYHLPLAAVAYPALLCALLGLIFTLWNFKRQRARHRQMKRLRALPDDLPDTLPPADTLAEQELQDVIRLLVQQKAQAAAESEQERARQNSYTATWAHQIKTPIASMRLHLQNEDSALSRTLRLELNRVEQYVEMLLVCQRLGSNSTDYLFREYDLDEMIRPALKRFSGEFIARRLKLNYQPIHLQVLTDAKWLGFVLEQLLSNALKYTASGEISIYMEGESTLCVRDTGMGIAPEDLPRIFENGYTGMNGRVERRASGLGLSLCRRVCGDLGHAIWAESRLGAGTVMRIDLSRRPLSAE